MLNKVYSDHDLTDSIAYRNSARLIALLHDMGVAWN